MVARVRPGTASVVYPRFTVPDAEHLRDTLLALRPISRLDLDFTRVREFQDSAIAILASALNALPETEIVLRGLTMHQRRLLKYFGVETPSAAL
jgi:hypothetical protein